MKNTFHLLVETPGTEFTVDNTDKPLRGLQKCNLCEGCVQSPWEIVGSL